MPSNELITTFIDVALWHGTLEQANAILSSHPEIAGGNIHVAAILGDDAAVRRFLAEDPENAFKKEAPYGGDALVYLCLSKYLRLDKARSGGFLRAASALLDAGADPNAGFWSEGEFETALYGAAGVAHDAELTRLLLERGADPNDNETFYHAPETYDNATLRVLVESGKMHPEKVSGMLLRKADWHDYEGIKYLLEHGADPNQITHWGFTALHQALRRDNRLDNVEVMLDHGADPTLETRQERQSGIVIAARRGRKDVLGLLERRGVSLEFKGVERLIAACARNDEAAVKAISANEPQLVAELLAQGGRLLAEFAGTGNTQGVGLLLGLGVSVTAPYEGDEYFGIPKDSTALHVAAWKAWHSTVRFLIERGAPVNLTDANGRTPLMLAVRACVDSYWKARRTPESVEALLRVGASVQGINLPAGYAEIDKLLLSAAN
ncbi:MAG TPA: ankyrin repeat domain-containing protein [Candidatus Sulfotelmatobacter sp.]|nr:ankyrin repeat domain-containing protein [Candidatus Sulfotelmatobacter sp.]